MTFRDCTVCFEAATFAATTAQVSAESEAARHGAQAEQAGPAEGQACFAQGQGQGSGPSSSTDCSSRAGCCQGWACSALHSTPGLLAFPTTPSSTSTSANRHRASFPCSSPCSCSSFEGSRCPRRLPRLEDLPSSVWRLRSSSVPHSRLVLQQPLCQTLSVMRVLQKA